jgi:hypothetical protein
VVVGEEKEAVKVLRFADINIPLPYSIALYSRVPNDRDRSARSLVG